MRYNGLLPALHRRHTRGSTFSLQTGHVIGGKSHGLTNLAPTWALGRPLLCRRTLVWGWAAENLSAWEPYAQNNHTLPDAWGWAAENLYMPNPAVPRVENE